MSRMMASKSTSEHDRPHLVVLTGAGISAENVPALVRHWTRAGRLWVPETLLE